KARMEEASKRIYKVEAPTWDGKWRMLIYTIPEEKRHIRDELRQELVWSGFGLLSNSCWITPNPLEEEIHRLVDKYDIKNNVSFFQATYEGMESPQALVQKCWDLDEMNEKYSQFIQEYSQKYVIDKNRLEQGEMDDGSCFVECAWLVHQYRKFLFIDPSLPKELLPEKWLGDSAAMLFKIGRASCRERMEVSDGIRDRNVTGVQTCALPIYLSKSIARSMSLTKIDLNKVRWTMGVVLSNAHGSSINTASFYLLIQVYRKNFYPKNGSATPRPCYS